MAIYLLTPRALADLEEIWDYSAQRWGQERAERYIRELFDGFERIAGEPRRGQSCDQVRAGYRKYAVGSHVVFYRQIAEDIDVVRVLHQSMDFERHL